MTVEFVCFEKDHRYLESLNHDGYVCDICGLFISRDEFQRRTEPNAAQIGLAPLMYCNLCESWHIPFSFDVNSLRLPRRQDVSATGEQQSTDQLALPE